MLLMIWMLIATVIMLGIIGFYFQIMLVENLKEKNISNIFFGQWVFNKNSLNKKGLFYRKAMFVCWGLALLLVMLIVNLQNSL